MKKIIFRILFCLVFFNTRPGEEDEERQEYKENTLESFENTNEVLLNTVGAYDDICKNFLIPWTNLKKKENKLQKRLNMIQKELEGLESQLPPINYMETINEQLKYVYNQLDVFSRSLIDPKKIIPFGVENSEILNKFREIMVAVQSQNSQKISFVSVNKDQKRKHQGEKTERDQVLTGRKKKKENQTYDLSIKKQSSQKEVEKNRGEDYLTKRSTSTPGEGPDLRDDIAQARMLEKLKKEKKGSKKKIIVKDNS